MTKRKSEGLDDLNMVEADSVRCGRAWVRAQVFTQCNYYFTPKNTTFIKFITKKDSVLEDWGERSQQGARMFALQPNSDQSSKRHKDDDIIIVKTELVR